MPAMRQGANVGLSRKRPGRLRRASAVIILTIMTILVSVAGG